MKFENPEIPEGINVTPVHPLREFFVLTAGAIALLAVIAFVLGQTGGFLAKFVPFEKELEITAPLRFPDEANAGLQTYLDELAGRVTAQMELPEEMIIKVHYDPGDTVNAFATLGGNIMLFRGLLEKLPHENALAMLIAHEIAHVKHRDPIVSLGSGVAVQLAMSLIFGQSSPAVLGNTGLYTLLHFSREMEASADDEALHVLQRLYGHVNGATALFETLHAERDAYGMSEPPPLFNSHPQDKDRIVAIGEQAQQKGWAIDGAVTPLPNTFGKWLSATH